MDPVLVSWAAPEFEVYERSFLWYLGVFFVAVSLLLISLWQQNFLFAIFIILATSLSIVWSKKEPVNFNIFITERGVKIGSNKFLHFNDLSSFSLMDSSQNNLEWGRLVLQPKHWFSPLVKIFIPQGKLAQSREVLAKYLKEESYENSLHDELVRFLKL